MIWVVASAKTLLKLYREVLLFSIGAVYGLQECSYYEFQYYGNGMLSQITAYDESARNTDEEYLDIEWEKEFYESGNLKSHTKYNSSYMKYYIDFYNEDGEETGSESGTYTKDGQKTPGAD